MDICPRYVIKEDPEWWNSLIIAYNAYQAGFLMEAGGIGNQHALYPSLMYTLADEFAKVEKANEADKPNASSTQPRNPNAQTLFDKNRQVSPLARGNVPPARVRKP